MSAGFAPKLATATIDLKDFGGEGLITVHALSTKNAMEVARLNEKFNNEEGDSIVAGIEIAIYVCKNCIEDAPFEITDEVIENFPPGLTTKISSKVMELQKDIPLA